DLLEQVFHDEPPAEGGIEAVFRRAEAIRRRRLRTVIAAGISAVILVAAVGYALATAIVPGPARSGAAAPAAAPARHADPALLAVRTAVEGDLRVVPREPVRGDGWRQYTVLDRDSGRPRGLIEVSVYAAPDGLCFPVLADRAACARPEPAGDGVVYVRYAQDRDVDWQVTQAIARRLSDGRVVAVMATGRRGTGDAKAGRPPLTASRAATLASSPGLMAAFGDDERCNGPDPACPLLKVPVPVK
ncbi:MAG TPA: hypothetical protein VFR35_01820, partial [Actinoplanes sp.]|nr:hypothetical protein [Actinoplanes sp.]